MQQHTYATAPRLLRLWLWLDQDSNDRPLEGTTQLLAETGQLHGGDGVVRLSMAVSRITGQLWHDQVGRQVRAAKVRELTAVRRDLGMPELVPLLVDVLGAWATSDPRTLAEAVAVTDRAYADAHRLMGRLGMSGLLSLTAVVAVHLLSAQADALDTTTDALLDRLVLHYREAELE